MTIIWTQETRKLSELTPWDRNPRQIKGEQARRLLESVETFGQVETLAIGPGNELYNGHQRLNVLRAAHGANYEVDVRVASRELTEKEREKLTIYLHKGAAGEWNFETLANEFEIGELLEWGFEGFELGLDDFDEKPVGEDPGPQTSKADELQAVWQVQPGDLWQVGEHRLLCGDCTDAAAVERVMGGEKANLLFTSPPYWVGKDYETQTTEVEIDQFIGACVRAWTDAVSVDNARIVINTGTAAIHRIEKKRKVEVLPLIDKWAANFRQRGWLLRHMRIWAKSGDLPASISPKTDVVDQRWEYLSTFSNESEEWEHIAAFWSPAGDQRGQNKIGTKWAQQGVWSDIQGDRSADGTHVAAFPAELPKRHIILYTQAGEIVAEPFSGSGTTIIACEQLSRRCRAIEIAPAYCAVALQRWADMTGKMPERIE